MKVKVSFEDIKDEINQIRKVHPKLKDDSAFVLWFVRAFLADSEHEALNSLTGVSNDKGIDAIMVDERAKQVHLVQGKFRQSLGESSEKRNDVIGFADLAVLPWESKNVLNTFYAGLDPLVQAKFQELVHAVRKNGYDLRLYYVTTGKCSVGLKSEAVDHVRQAEGPAEITICDAPHVRLIFKDYLEGVAPAVPTLLLKIATEGQVRTDGVIHRFDADRKIESWVFSMTAKDVGGMYAKAGIRLFARNVRGYLGSSNDINESMSVTVKDEPHNFWYYNNGVTVICDEARRETQEREDVLRVERPQVINGQQTTRTLEGTSSSHAHVLVKVIKVPRTDGDDELYDDLVSSIVIATNRQNAVKPSDLISNDHTQVFLERELRKRGYQYLRKRQTKKEARRLPGGIGVYQVRKEEMAQAVAACQCDPAVVLKGKEILFDESYYRSVFASHSISFYLARLWLMWQVQYIARRSRQRAYAKWLVLRFLWDNVANDIGGQSERHFRYACEQVEIKVLSRLYSVTDDLFKAASVFYGIERGKGEQAMDRQTFFKQPNLLARFSTFWRSNRNSYRTKVKIKLEKFRGQLRDMTMEDL